jgi:hypothetical protein
MGLRNCHRQGRPEEFHIKNETEDLKRLKRLGDGIVYYIGRTPAK